MATWAYGMGFGKGGSAVIKYSEASVVGTLLLLMALVMGFVYLAVQRQQEVSSVRRDASGLVEDRARAGASPL